MLTEHLMNETGKAVTCPRPLRGCPFLSQPLLQGLHRSPHSGSHDRGGESIFSLFPTIVRSVLKPAFLLGK